MKYNNRLNKDLGFSNTIHKKLVEPLFQKKFGINLIQANIDWDRNDSIDYIGLKNNKKYSFQERIRRFSNYTKNSFEFTLRYERNNSLSENQKKSEFFKINAQFLFYSILNEDLNDFNRYCIINIKNLMKCLDKGLIKTIIKIKHIYIMILQYVLLKIIMKKQLVILLLLFLMYNTFKKKLIPNWKKRIK